MRILLAYVVQVDEQIVMNSRFRMDVLQPTAMDAQKRPNIFCLISINHQEFF